MRILLIEDDPVLRDVVQRSLGHASVTTTQRYAHVDDGELRAALRGLPAFGTSTTNVVRIKR